MDSSGKTAPLLAKLGAYGAPRFSPDGKRLAFTAPGGKGTDVWVYDWERDTPLAHAAMWVGLVTWALAERLERHPEWLLVTHETLCSNPLVLIRDVCERAGLTWGDDVERFLRESDRPGTGFSNVRVTRDQPNRWRGRLNDSQVEGIGVVLSRFPTRGWIRAPQPANGVPQDPRKVLETPDRV